MHRQLLWKDKIIPYRMYILTVVRIILKITILTSALVLQTNTRGIIVILAVIFFTELYVNIANLLIVKGKNERYIGAFVSALDGIFFIFVLYISTALQSDLYLFILFSIALNTAAYGFLSALVEGIVAGFSYALFIFLNPLTFVILTAEMRQTYILRVSVLVFLGWITGWLANELSVKEEKLHEVLENDKHEEELNEIKENFLNDAAVNVKTPLSAVKGYVEIMLNGRVGDVTPKVEEYLTHISENIEEISAVVDELLHIIEIEHDVIRITKKDKPVMSLVQNLMNDVRAFAKMRGREIRIEETIDSGIHILVDEYRLKIALKNVMFYFFDVTEKNILFSCSQKEDTMQITCKAYIHNNDMLQCLVNGTPENGNREPLLKFLTSRLIIESHNGKVNITRVGKNSVKFTILLPVVTE